MSRIEIGCCGAYCKTCKLYTNDLCRGCKIGYDDKSRDIAKARCKIKICCIDKNYITCADCAKYDSCEIIQEFYNHKGYKYKKYKEATSYISKNGYDCFLQNADSWRNAYGSYK